MNESDYGKLLAPGTLRFERILPGPPERIWAWLTESEKRGKWLAYGDVEPRKGGRVDFRFKHNDLSEQEDSIPEKYRHMKDGTAFTGRVTQYDPPHLLSYTRGEGTGEVSEITYELIPKGEKVLLILTHRRLDDDHDLRISVAAGWHTHLGILSDRLNGIESKGFWSVHSQMEKEYKKKI